MGILRDSAYVDYEKKWHKRHVVYDCPINATILIDDIQEVIIGNLNQMYGYYYKITPYPDSHWMGA